MWNELETSWQYTLELLWKSFVNESSPIGAIITDEQGDIVTVGRNRITDRTSQNPIACTRMAHAEMTAMMQLKTEKHPDIRKYKLYVTLEPCPMCFGTMLLMHIGELVYGTADKWAGATNLIDKNEYMRTRRIKIRHEGGHVEVFQVVLQIYHEMVRRQTRENVVELWKETNFEAAELGERLVREHYFEEVGNIPVNEVFDEIISMYSDLVIENKNSY